MKKEIIILILDVIIRMEHFERNLKVFRVNINKDFVQKFEENPKKKYIVLQKKSLESLDSHFMNILNSWDLGSLKELN